MGVKGEAGNVLKMGVAFTMVDSTAYKGLGEPQGLGSLRIPLSARGISGDSSNPEQFLLVGGSDAVSTPVGSAQEQDAGPLRSAKSVPYNGPMETDRGSDGRR